MRFVKKHLLLLITLVILGTIIAVPPVFYKDSFIVINNDTTAHLAVFEKMKNGETQYLYLGQQVTGYMINWLNSITGVSNPELFMWFNFVTLFIASVVVSLLVLLTTKSQLAAALAAGVVVFGIGATMQLFLCGTIFNIIEILILFPTILALIYFSVTSKKLRLLTLPATILLGTTIYFFHPSLGSGINLILKSTPEYTEAILSPIYTTLVFFGITNLLVLVLCVVSLLKRKSKVNIGTKVVISSLAIILFILSLLAFGGLTPYSSRMAMNLCLVAGVMLCIVLGLELEQNRKLSTRLLLIVLPLVGIMPNLVNWFIYAVGKGAASVYLG